MGRFYFEAADTVWKDPRFQTVAAGRIPYPKLRQELFSSASQAIIPFLGAGASVPSPIGKDAQEPSPAGEAAELAAKTACEQLDIKDERLQLFVATTLRIASAFQARVTATASAPVAAAAFDPMSGAPSAYDLAKVLSDAAQYVHLEYSARKLESFAQNVELKRVVDMLETLVNGTGVGSAVPPLLSVASYFQSDRRGELWDALFNRFKPVSQLTLSHELVAKAAAEYFSRPARKHYLIVTTNYDRLIEKALTLKKVPWCVVTVGNSDPRRVFARFGPTVDDCRTFDAPDDSFTIGDHFKLEPSDFAQLQQESTNLIPANFFLELPKQVAFIFKMHGCLNETERSRDSVVISDQDYTAYLADNGVGLNIIPNQIKQIMMGQKPFLFMGYSFSDWNVRSLYHQLQRLRNFKGSDQEEFNRQDYAVVKAIDPYVNGFIPDQNIAVLVTTLDQFAQTILENGK